MFFWEDWYTYAIVGVVALIVLIAFFRNYVKVPPNVALIVSGRTVETLDLGDTEGLEESAVPAEEE